MQTNIIKGDLSKCQ